MRFDLHCHSTRSDGSDPPDRLARRATTAGIEVLAVTDHDTCTVVEVPGTRTIRGSELTVDNNGETIHVLAYDRGGDWKVLEDALEAMREARRDRLRAMAERLTKLGVTVDIAPLLADADRRSVGRPDSARIVVEAKRASSMKEAFSRYLYDGGPVDLPHRVWPIAEALAVGRAAGAVMSLAHPHYYDTRGAELVRQHRDNGLTGIEAFYGSYDLARRRRWIEVADQLGCTCTGGSDWHGTDRDDIATGMGVEIPQRRAALLLEWLSA